MAEKRLGRYRLQSEFAGEGPTVLYQAYDEHLRREVLLEVAPGGFAEVAAQARVRARLAHHALPALLDLSEEQGRPFLVLERPEGERLSDRLELGGALGTPQALDLGRQVAGALAYAHGQGACHGKLSAASVVLSPTGRVAVLGLARDLPEPPAGRATEVREDVRAAAAVLARALGARAETRLLPPSLPPRLGALLTRALGGELADCAALLAELDAPNLLSRPTAGQTASEDAVAPPSRAATIALGVGFSLVLAGSLLQVISLSVLGALAAGAGIFAGERRRGLVGLAFGLVGALSAWWAGGRL